MNTEELKQKLKELKQNNSDIIASFNNKVSALAIESNKQEEALKQELSKEESEKTILSSIVKNETKKQQLKEAQEQYTKAQNKNFLNSEEAINFLKDLKSHYRPKATAKAKIISDCIKEIKNSLEELENLYKEAEKGKEALIIECLSKNNKEACLEFLEGLKRNNEAIIKYNYRGTKQDEITRTMYLNKLNNAMESLQESNK